MPFSIAGLMTGATATASTATAGAIVTTGGITAATLAADAAILSGGYGAYSQYQQGKYAEKAGEIEAARLSGQAEQVEEASEYEERGSRREAKRLTERQRVQFAGGGVVPSAGTPLRVISDTKAEMEMDIGSQKYGYGLEAGRLRRQAEKERWLGKSRKRASRYYAGTSLATGAYRTASLYM